MVCHIVLFRPRPDLAEKDRTGLLDAISQAATAIPGVRSFRIGERVTLGRGYEQAMTQHYPYAALIEFDDIVGLRAYLEHPQHETLGMRFYECAEALLIYDYQMSGVDGRPIV